MSYARIILPLKLDEAYHYRIPPEWAGRVKVGQRVIVSLGPTRFYTGIVRSLEADLPEGLKASQVKPITEVPDDEPLIYAQTLACWKWMAQYYLCTEGDVMRAALPAGLLPESKTVVRLEADFVANAPLKPTEQEILDILALQKELSMPLLSVQRAIAKPAMGAFSRLIALGAVTAEEVVVSRYKPRTDTFIRLAPGYRTERGMNEAADLLNRAKRQQELFYTFIEQLEADGGDYERAYPLRTISRGDTNRSALLRQLVKRGILVTSEEVVSRILPPSGAQKVQLPTATVPLTLPTKGIAYLAIDHAAYKEAAIIKAITDCLAQGRQVLLLSPLASEVPTQQSFTTRLRAATGNRLFIYDTATNDQLKVEYFHRVSHSPEPVVVMGMRNAVLLPFCNLGLIIVDEEQEYGLKSQATPRYHARDVAIWLGHQQQLPVLLASETPSAETLFNVMRGKYQRLTLPPVDSARQQMPRIEAIDMRRLLQQRRIGKGESFSPMLLEAITETLQQGQRVMILQNRRGYAPFLSCKDCGKPIYCPHCDVTLTYHQRENRLTCHYCGYQLPTPRSCPACGALPNGHEPALESVGYGIERIEEEVKKRFPKAKVLRIDSDVMMSAKQRAEVQQRIDEGEVNIIVGTQLIKGQPIWDDVALIGVVRLDAILGYPDFRSYERAYQLLHQLAMRSAEGSGGACRMLLQTYDIENPFITMLQAGDYAPFITTQLEERELCAFPPFVRMTTVVLKGFDEPTVEACAHTLYQMLAQRLPAEAVGMPQKPSVARIDMQYIRHITLRRQPHVNYQTERNAWHQAMAALWETDSRYKKVRIYADVDPL